MYGIKILILFKFFYFLTVTNFCFFDLKYGNQALVQPTIKLQPGSTILFKSKSPCEAETIKSIILPIDQFSNNLVKTASSSPNSFSSIIVFMIAKANCFFSVPEILT